MMLKLVLVAALLVLGAEAHCHPYSCEKAKPRLQLCLNNGYKPEKLEGCKVGKGEWEMSAIQTNICKKLEEKVAEEKCDFECEKDLSGGWEQVDLRIDNDGQVTKEGSPSPKVELGKYQVRIMELKTVDKRMYLNIRTDLFGDTDGKLLGYVSVLMNIELEYGQRKISGQTRWVIEVDDEDRCNNKRDDPVFPMLDDLNMVLDYDFNSDTLVKFKFAMGGEYTDNARNDCDDFDQWEALMKRVTHMQINKVSTWLPDFEDYVKVEYKFVGSE